MHVMMLASPPQYVRYDVEHIYERDGACMAITQALDPVDILRGGGWRGFNQYY